MLFNSLHFLVFFPVVVLLYFVLPFRFRWAMLLAASYYFYMAWRAPYALVLAALTLIDYTAGRLIAAEPSQRRRLRYLFVSLSANLGLLFTFKYLDFFARTLNAGLAGLGIPGALPTLGLVLPIGISFHTFQTMSYAIEVYRRRVPAERHLGRFALYVAFFPQLVAGPIERPQRLLPQFRERHTFDSVRAADGLRLMLWGFFKKCVIADRLASPVDVVFANPTAFEPVALLVATLAFTMQIYCDFSGYSDIAIGAARVMGFRLSENFRTPYAAESMVEFWRRWHISLSSWFRDYVYLPLGGNRVGPLRRLCNLMITFLLSGLWHGANWTFVLWGALHGTAVSASVFGQDLGARLSRAVRLGSFPALRAVLRTTVTFGIAAVSWVFFRANSVADAFYILGSLGRGIWGGFGTANLALFRSIGINGNELSVALASILLLEVVQVSQRAGLVRALLAARPTWQRFGLYYGLIIWILLFGRFASQEFIYFQF